VSFRRAAYNLQQRLEREVGLCSEVASMFRAQNGLGWERIGYGYYYAQHGTQHVVPINDLRPHVESVACWCRPYLYDEDGSETYVHEALDQRDAVERGDRMVQ